MNNLANVYEGEGKFAEAEALSGEALEIRRRVLGAEYPVTAMSVFNLANVYRDEGKNAQAETLYSEAVAIQRRVLGPEHHDTIGSMNSLANVYLSEGKYVQVQSLFREALKGQPDNSDWMNVLAWCLLAAPSRGERRPQEALDLIRRAIMAAPDSGAYYSTLGLAEYRNGLWDDAIAALNKSAELNKGAEPTDFFFLSMSHWKRGDKADAVRFFEQGVDVASKRTSVDAELRMFWTEAAELLGEPRPKAAAS